MPRPPLDQYAFVEESILVLICPGVLALLYYSRHALESTLARYIFGSLALWSLLVVLNPFLNPERGWLSVAGRLRGLTYILVAVLVPSFICLLARVRRIFIPYAIVCILPLLLVSARMPLPRGMQPAYISERERLLLNLSLHQKELGELPIVIAAHGDEFVVTYALGIPSQQRPPTDIRYKSVYWLLHFLPKKAVSSSTINLFSDGQDTCTALVKNEELPQTLNSLEAFDRQRLFAINPHLSRAFTGILHP